MAFAIFIFGLLIFNRESISRGIQIIQNEFASGEASDELADPAPPSVSHPPVASLNPAQPPEAAFPQEDGPVPQAPEPSPEDIQGQAAENPQAEHSSAAELASAELRDRSLYFIQVDRGGSILRVRAVRRLPVSDSPMMDVIQALLGGPSTDEKDRGLISLIPPDTNILSVSIRGNTAYISFSEDFQYNTYGVEGYASQLRQVVFTVTEFPNVADVQILIEGRRIDYLGEGIWIGSPISREML